MLGQANKHLHHLWLNACNLFSPGDAVDLGLDEKLADSEVAIHSRALWSDRSETKHTDHSSRPTSEQRASNFNKSGQSQQHHLTFLRATHRRLTFVCDLGNPSSAGWPQPRETGSHSGGLTCRRVIGKHSAIGYGKDRNTELVGELQVFS